jgi:hypothetical protein
MVSCQRQLIFAPYFDVVNGIFRFEINVEYHAQPLCTAEDYPKIAVTLGEHCLSSAAGHVLCALLGRVAQPRVFEDSRGNAAGAVSWGRLFFDYLPLATQKKVISGRAAPGLFS